MPSKRAIQGTTDEMAGETSVWHVGSSILVDIEEEQGSPGAVALGRDAGEDEGLVRAEAAACLRVRGGQASEDMHWGLQLAQIPHLHDSPLPGVARRAARGRLSEGVLKAFLRENARSRRGAGRRGGGGAQRMCHI